MIPNTKEIGKIYNLSYVPDHLKSKADKYITNINHGNIADAYNDPADEEFYCI